jgi:NAD(P) transhydrogenase
MILGRSWDEIIRDGDTIRTSFSDSPSVLQSERVLFAAGRVGATAGLGLEALGISVNHRGYIAVDEGYRTSVPSVLAAGDVIGAPALASTSMEQGRVAVCRAFGFTYKQHVSDLVPTGIYTIPEVSSVGLAEQAAEDQGYATATGWAPFGRNVRGLLQEDTRGGVKLVFDRASRRLLGAHIIGEHAAELIHTGQSMVMLGGTVDTIIETVFSYPTLSESYKYAAYDALAKMNAG